MSWRLLANDFGGDVAFTVGLEGQDDNQETSLHNTSWPQVKEVVKEAASIVSPAKP
jgi:hypothetical protein